MTDEEPNQERRRLLSNPSEFETFQSAASLVRVDVSALSDRGTVRPFNEDHFLILRLGRFQETVATSVRDAELPPRFEESAYAMIVADGVGGAGAGALASRVAISSLAHLGLRYGRWNVRVGLRESEEIREQSEFFLRRLNDVLFRTSMDDPRLAGMATSFTAVYSAGHDLFFSHVGNSRAYVLHDGNMTQLTRDATPGRIGLPLGVSGEDPTVQIEQMRLWDGDRLLLCTDGLTHVLHHDVIADVLALRRRPAEDCRILIDLALRAGTSDNVTVLIADYTIPPSAA